MVMNMLTPYWVKPLDLDRWFKPFLDPFNREWCVKPFSDPCTGAPMIKVPIRHEELWKELERKFFPIYRVTDIWRIPYANITEGILARGDVVWLHLSINNPMDEIKFDINNKEEVIRWNSMKILSR